MAVQRDAKIVRISDFFGPESSPSDSPPECPKPPDTNPGRQPRILMRRFFVRRFYRRRDRASYWYARVTDLNTGRTFRVSSGEKNLKKADKTLRLKLRVLEESGLEPETPGAGGPYANELMDQAVEELMGEESPPPMKLVADWVKDDNYAVMAETFQAVMRLAERGQHAITPEDLKRSIQEAIPQSPEPKGPLFNVAFEEFLRTKDVRDSTLKDYQDTPRLFSRFLKQQRVHRITGLHVQGFLESLKRDGKSQRTRQKHLNCLRSFFRWARDVAKYTKEDPTAGIKIRVQRSMRRKKRLGLSLDEAKSLLAACRVKRKQKRHDIQHVWLAVFVALRTGMRLGNVLGLRWSQIDLERGTIHVPAIEYKTDSELQIPMHDELWRVLRLWKVIRRDSPLLSDSSFVLGRKVRELKVPFKAAAARAGVKTDFHNLRHAFETWLVEADVPGPVQSALMGHSPGSVTEGYAHPSLEKTRECVNRIPRLLDRGTSSEESK